MGEHCHLRLLRRRASAGRPANCSDGVTYKMMEKFFSGLAQTGAWACLDEFNRINIEVLSVIASQLAEVRTALLAKAEKFTFQGVPDVAQGLLGGCCRGNASVCVCIGFQCGDM